MGKAAAQESDSLNIHKIEVTQDIPAPLDAKYMLGFDTFPSYDQIMEFIQNRDDIKIQEQAFENYDELYSRIAAQKNPLICAFYNPVNGIVTINFIRATGGLSAPIGRDSRLGSIDNQIDVRSAFNQLVRSFNDGIPGMVQHELWHQRNDACVSLYGLTFDEIVDTQVHDEFSAVVAELMFRRKVYMKTGSIKDSFRGVEANSLRSVRGGQGVFRKYEKFLKKNSKILTDTITAAEADLMIQLSIDCFEDYQDQYAINIPNVIAYKTNRLYRAYCGADSVSTKPFDGYQGAIRKMYTYGDVCLLDVCSENGRAMIESALRRFFGT